MTAALDIDGLTVQYGPAAAVRDVSLSVAAGTVTGLTGNNGAGKTSLMHAVAGLAKARRGTLRLHGTDVTSMPTRKRTRLGMALVPEGRHVFADQTVEENIRLGFIERDGVRYEQARDGALDLFPELREHLDRPAGALSGGQQQMLAVARALASGPSLLLLDEPFLGLAPVVVDRMCEGIRELASRGITVLVSDSAARRMLAVCDYGYVLRVGEVAAHGSVAELTEQSDLASLLLGTA